MLFEQVMIKMIIEEAHQTQQFFRTYQSERDLKQQHQGFQMSLGKACVPMAYGGDGV